MSTTSAQWTSPSYTVVSWSSGSRSVMAQLDESRVGSAPRRLMHGVLEQGVRGGKTRIDVVHRGGGDDEDPGWRARGLGVLLEQMRRLVLDQFARHHGWRLHVHAVRPLLHREHRDLLLVVAFGSLARDHAVLPGVPGAHHDLAV